MSIEYTKICINFIIELIDSQSCVNDEFKKKILKKFRISRSIQILLIFKIMLLISKRLLFETMTLISICFSENISAKISISISISIIYSFIFNEFDDEIQNFSLKDENEHFRSSIIYRFFATFDAHKIFAIIVNITLHNDDAYNCVTIFKFSNNDVKLTLNVNHILSFDTQTIFIETQRQIKLIFNLLNR